MPFQNKAILSARNAILLQLAIPCIALSYRSITSFKGIVVYVKGLPFVQGLKRCHTQPSSFTKTAVCVEGYFLQGMLRTFERILVWKCMCVCISYIYIYICIYILCIYISTTIILRIMFIENGIGFSRWIVSFFEGILHKTIIQSDLSWSHQVLSKGNVVVKNTWVYAN